MNLRNSPIKMNEEKLLSTIGKLRRNLTAGKRAPHKPLLILFSLARIQQGKERLVEFSEIDGVMSELLREYLPPRRHSKASAYYPFNHLRGDGIWELSGAGDLSVAERVPKQKLISQKICGGFTPEVYRLLSDNPKTLEKVASHLLHANFPETIHRDILDEIGLEMQAGEVEGGAGKKRKSQRNQEFRKQILTIYNFRCAVCQFDVRLGSHSVALEAAHIKWFNAGGLDVASNGLALCSLHHKLFDRGAFGITEQHKVVISDRVNGYAGLEEWLIRFNEKPINLPRKADQIPAAEFTRWHLREVFQGESY